MAGDCTCFFASEWIVAFHAQQAVEKCFKSLMEEHDLEAQKVHRLITLYAKIEIFLVGEQLN